MTGHITQAMIILASVAMLWIAACGEVQTSDSNWIVVDTVHATVDTIEVPETWRARRGIPVVFVVQHYWAEMYHNVVLQFSHVEIKRTSGTITYEIWGDLRAWAGEGPPPPCYGCGFTHEHLEPALFELGDLLIRVRQPVDASIERTVRIVP